MKNGMNTLRSGLFTATAAILLLLTPPVTAEEQASGVLPFLKPKIEQVVSILQNPDRSVTEKKERIEKVVDPVFDYRLMAKLVLGPVGWPRLNEDQRERYVPLFTRVFKFSYFDKMNRVSEVKVEFGTPEEKGSGKVYVPSIARFKNRDVDIEYRLYRAGEGEGWKIFDVVVNGVSIVRSYQSQYRDYLKKHSPEELFNEMNEKIQKLDEQLKEVREEG